MLKCSTSKKWEVPVSLAKQRAKLPLGIPSSRVANATVKSKALTDSTRPLLSIIASRTSGSSQNPQQFQWRLPWKVWPGREFQPNLLYLRAKVCRLICTVELVETKSANLEQLNPRTLPRPSLEHFTFHCDDTLSRATVEILGKARRQWLEFECACYT